MSLRERHRAFAKSQVAATSKTKTFNFAQVPLELISLKIPDGYEECRSRREIGEGVVFAFSPAVPFTAVPVLPIIITAVKVDGTGEANSFSETVGSSFHGLCLLGRPESDGPPQPMRGRASDCMVGCPGGR